VIIEECDDHGLKVLFPHLAGVVIERVEQAAGGVLMWTRSRVSEVACHACGCRPPPHTPDQITRRRRLGGLLNEYQPAA
jgi:hypothetical protein